MRSERSRGSAAASAKPQLSPSPTLTSCAIRNVRQLDRARSSSICRAGGARAAAASCVSLRVRRPPRASAPSTLDSPSACPSSVLGLSAEASALSAPTGTMAGAH